MNMKVPLVLYTKKIQSLGMIAVYFGMTKPIPNPFRVPSTPAIREELDDIEDLLDSSSVPFDSIMDSDSEEEDEISDLLLAKV